MSGSPKTSSAVRGASRRLRIGVRAALFIAFAAYFTATGRAFLSQGNVYSILESFAFVGLIALALSLTMIAGEFDLSVGAVSITAGILAIQWAPSDLMLGLIVAVGLGLLVGILNGVLVARLGVASMVVTIGTLIAAVGVGVFLTGGVAVSSSDFALSSFITQPLMVIFSPRSLVVIGIFVIVALALRFTRMGRDIVAVGSDRKAATAAGVRATRPILTVFVASGILGALAGALLAYSLASATPDLAGGGAILLQGVTAAIIGGISLKGGIGTVPGVAFGALLLAILNNGLGAVGASGTVISLANGLLLLLVVLVDSQSESIVRTVRRRFERQPLSAGAG